MASTCLGSCDAFFLRPSAPYKDLSSEPFPAVCREGSVLSDHNARRPVGDPPGFPPGLGPNSWIERMIMSFSQSPKPFH